MAAKRSTKRTTPKKAPARAAKKKAAPKKKAVVKKVAAKKPAARKAKPAAKPAKAVKKPAAAKKAAPSAKAPTAAPATPPPPPKAATAAFQSRFVWFDLMTKDIPAAQAFYKGLLGWTTKDVDVAPPMNKYTMFSGAGEDFGGVMPLPEPNAPVIWLPYVSVEDVDQTTKRVEALGGRVLMGPQDIPNVGRFSVISDPTGGVLSPMSFIQPPKAPTKPGLVGPAAWCELMTDDPEKAGAFYRELFGWGGADVDMGPAGKYHMFKLADRNAGGMGTRPPVLDHNTWIPYFAVDSVDQKHQAAKAAGAKEIAPPDDIPNVGRSSWLADPQGALFALFTPKM